LGGARGKKRKLGSRRARTGLWGKSSFKTAKEKQQCRGRGESKPLTQENRVEKALKNSMKEKKKQPITWTENKTNREGFEVWERLGTQGTIISRAGTGERR